MQLPTNKTLLTTPTRLTRKLKSPEVHARASATLWAPVCQAEQSLDAPLRNHETTLKPRGPQISITRNGTGSH